MMNQNLENTLHKNQKRPFRSLAFLCGLPALAVLCAAAANPEGSAGNSNFSDTSTWIRWAPGTGVELTPAGQGFATAYAANAQPNPNPVNGKGIPAGYISTFALRGDFTLDIDYALTTWPASSGVRLGLAVWPSVCMIRQGQGPYTQEWLTFGAGPYSSIPTDDRRGTLRLARTGGTLLGYYRSLTDGSWVLVGSRTGDPVFTNDFQVYVCSWTDSSTFGHEAVGITLSNFVMTANTVLPGPYGVPFWAVAPAVTSQAQSAAPTRPFHSRARPLPGAFPQNSNFSDTSTWISYVAGSGVQLTPAGQGVAMSYEANAQPSPGSGPAISASYLSTFALRGDFTIDIDYALTTWPASSGVRLGLSVLWPGMIGIIREGQGPARQELYTFGAGPYSSIPTDDQHGTLRLVRTGGTLRGYCRSSTDGSWVLVGSRTGDPVFTNDFQVSVSSWTDSSTFGHAAVGITLSNFVMKADTVLPGPYGLPSWAAALAHGNQPQSQTVAPVARFDNGFGIRPWPRAERRQSQAVPPATQLEVPAPPSPGASPQNSSFSDMQTWIRWGTGSGVELTPAGQGFAVAYAANAQPSPGKGLGISDGYISTFALRGDFTLDIDYALTTWPASSGVRLGLGVCWPSICMIRQGQGPYTQEWLTFGAGPYSSIPTDERHGTLRLARAGGTLLGYYRSLTDGSWVLVGSRTGDPVFTNDFQVSVNSWTDSSTFGHEAVGITLSNFVVKADTVLPGPYGIPFRVLAPGTQMVAPMTQFQNVTRNRPGLRPQPWQGPAVPPARPFDLPAPPLPGGIHPLESAALPTGILDEDLNLDLNAAIQSYQTLVTQFDTQRPLAANAIFRMAECYRRLGRMDEARTQYARILREFADQAPLVRLSRKYVASLTATPAISSPPEQRSLPSRTYDLANADPQDVRQILQDLFQRSGQNHATNLTAAPAAPLPAGGVWPGPHHAAGRTVLAGWWAGEGNADDSTGANNGVLEGGVTFVPGEVGQAFSFDGTTGDVRVPASPSLDVGAGPGMTIAAWVRPADLSTERCVLEWNYGGFGALLNISVSLEGGGVGPGAFTANFKDVNLQHHLINSPPGVLTTNRFQHVAATYDRTTGDAALYLDGAIVTQANLGIFTPRTIGDLYFGVRPSDAGGVMRFVGQIDEVAVYRCALSEAEVEALHAAGGAGQRLVPPAPRRASATAAAPLPAGGVSPGAPLPAGLVSWWAGEGNANDSQGASNGILEGGVTFDAGAVGKAFSFNGTDADVKVPAGPSLDVGSGTGLTVEAWINPSDISVQHPIVEWNDITDDPPYGAHLWLSVGGPWHIGCIYANLVDTSGMSHLLTSSADVVKPNAWQHVALTYDKGTGTALLYCDGEQVAQAFLGNFTPQTSWDLYLGFRPAGGPGAGNRFVGQMDEVTLYNRALSAAEIQAIYAAGGAGKRVATLAPSSGTATLESQLAQARNEPIKAKFELDMTDILERGNIEKDVPLQPGDYIIVPSRSVTF